MKVAGIQFDIAWEDKQANFGRVKAIECAPITLLPARHYSRCR